MAKKVVIGLSGGLDSTMAALILKREGYDVVGLHFSFTDEKYSDSLNNIIDKLGIEVVFENIRDDFKTVKQHFANEYLNGRTPSPCTFCNRIIKWQKLLDFADRNNCDFIASGHYIQKTKRQGNDYLQKGVDQIKDQSYFLWELSSDLIKRMINPLGNYTKDQVRDMAKKYGFESLARKNESMGVCFLHNSDYRDFLQGYIPNEIEKIGKGIVIDTKGEKIGYHKGYIYYTIGQKRDLDLVDNRKAYVTKIDATNNTLTVDRKESLNHYNILLNNIHLINQDDLIEGSLIHINVRGYGLNPDELAEVKEIKSGTVLLKLTSPAWAVAPGQPVVFYKDDVVLGGGIAEKSW